MMISSRGRYALRVMVDLAEHSNQKYIPMKEVAERQNISLKYLEKILPCLSKSNFVVGVHGKGGGYRLTKAPSEYKVGDILRLTDGQFVTVACLDCNSKKCDNEESCRTRPMWHKLQSIINDYLDSVTIEDLMKDDSVLNELSPKN